MGYSTLQHDKDTSQSQQNLSRSFYVLRDLFKMVALDKKFSGLWSYTSMMLPIVWNHHGGEKGTWFAWFVKQSSVMRRIDVDPLHVPSNSYSPEPDFVITHSVYHCLMVSSWFCKIPGKNLFLGLNQRFVKSREKLKISLGIWVHFRILIDSGATGSTLKMG